jgi:hypothetical protein
MTRLTLPLALFFQHLSLCIFFLLYGVEGVVSALVKCQLFFIVLLSVLESSIGHSSMLKILLLCA